MIEEEEGELPARISKKTLFDCSEEVPEGVLSAMRYGTGKNVAI